MIKSEAMRESDKMIISERYEYDFWKFDPPNQGDGEAL